MQKLITCLTGACVAAAAALFLCQPVVPELQPRLQAPQIKAAYLTESKLRGRFVEAFHIAWQSLPEDSRGTASYVLLRKTGKDSVFDLFPYSLNIPPEITSFTDDLTQIGFPRDTFALVLYRLFAIDTFGRAGDTSAVCTLHLAPQPKLEIVNSETGCFRWLSRGIQGSISSYIRVWNAERSIIWESWPREEFGSENSPVTFSSCIADSLRPLAGERWYTALYLRANGYEQQSMKVDSFNVP